MSNNNDGASASPGSREILALDDYRGDPSIEDQAIRWLARLSDTDATLDQRAEFFHWLESNPAHASAFEEVSKLWSVSADVAANPMFRWVPTYKRRFVSAMSLAAVVLVAFVVLLAAPVVYQTQPGEQQRVVLADGSTAFLNTDSRIRVHMRGHSRLIELTQGEVWVDVVSDPERPFSVSTDKISVTATGTAYAVHKRSPANLRVTVTEGTVDVRLYQNVAAEPVSVTAGQNLHLDLGGPVPITTKGATPASSLAWQRGQLVYQNVKLNDLLLDLSRYVPRNLVVSDDTVGTKNVSAVLSISDQEAMLDALTLSMGLSWKQVSDELILITPRQIK